MTVGLILWSAKTSIVTARQVIKQLMKMEQADSVTVESLETEVLALSNVLDRLEKLECWLKLVDSQRNIS